MQFKYYFVITTAVLGLAIRSTSLPQITDDELYEIINKILKSSETEIGKKDEIDLIIDETVPEKVNTKTKSNLSNLKVTNNTEPHGKESNVYYVKTKTNPSIIFRPKNNDEIETVPPVNDTNYEDIELILDLEPKISKNEPVQLNQQNVTKIKTEAPAYRSGMPLLKKQPKTKPKEIPARNIQISNDGDLNGYLSGDPLGENYKTNSYPYVPIDIGQYITIRPSEFMLDYLIEMEKFASRDAQSLNNEKITNDFLFGVNKMTKHYPITPLIKNKVELSAETQKLLDYTLLHNFQNAGHKEENEREIINISDNFHSLPNIPYLKQFLTYSKIPLNNYCRHCYNIEPPLKTRPQLSKLNLLVNPFTNDVMHNQYGFKYFNV